MKRIFVAALLLSGCAAKPAIPGSEKVFLSNEPPDAECEFIGEVVGGQGNWWTDDITPMKNSVEGSRNDLRNKAFKMGANYVHIQSSSKSSSYMGGTTMGIAGNAYKCKQSD